MVWGSEERGDHHAGNPEDGMLAGMIENGWIVTATDYASDFSTSSALQPFALGKVEAANAIDNLRAAHHLLRKVYGDLPTSTYDVVTWGHSQGGHAAMWTGQLLEEYGAATKDLAGPELALSGVVVEAPASNLLTDPIAQGEDALGLGLFDWVVHSKLQLTGQPQAIPIAPFFMSYLDANLLSRWTGRCRPCISVHRLAIPGPRAE
ncbi:MAG: lipase family protein [Thermomicrobiales bacterium]